MDTTSTDILVILLSVSMSIVLVLTIVALAYAIKILRHLKRITETAEHIASNVDTVSEFFKKTAGPVAITKLIANIVDVVKRKSEKKGK